MKRILCSLLVAILPSGSVLADTPKSKNAKVTLVSYIPLAVATLGFSSRWSVGKDIRH
jgi:hypothetical protein